MNQIPSPLLLIGVGGAGSAMVRNIQRAYGPGLRALTIDTDADSGRYGDIPFTLLGGNRLNGRGTGGQPSAARAAFQDNPALLDPALTSVRTAVIVTGLGGGTGGGATGELLKHLHTLGITTLLFATLPFNFEGEERQKTARAAAGPVEQHADVSVFLPLDELVAGTDNMREALARGIETLASGVTLLWRLLEKPGYIRLDAERLRTVLSRCGRGFFATAVAQGEDRDAAILTALAESPLLKRRDGETPVRSILVGVLAGDDLRLSEIGGLVGGLAAVYGPDVAIELGTVNDESVFSGRLAVVILVFEEGSAVPQPKQTRLTSGSRALSSNTRFTNAERTLWHDEDLDVPTYLRRNLTLDR
jgi:cell division protein FtsZ